MKSITTVMQVLKLAAETLPRKIVQVDGDVTRLEGNKKLFHINEVDGQGGVIARDVLQITVSDVHLQVVSSEESLRQFLDKDSGQSLA